MKRESKVYIDFFKTNILIIAICFIAGVSLALAYSLTQPLLYNGTVLVEFLDTNPETSLKVDKAIT